MLAPVESYSASIASVATETRRRIGMIVAAVGLLLAAWPSGSLLVVLLGLTLAGAVGLPLSLSASPRAASAVLPLVVLAVVAIGAWAPCARATSGLAARDRTHDGGVIVTREAARLTVGGQNPYAASYRRALPTSWSRVQGADGLPVANPVIDHDPYLPGSFLVEVPFLVVADMLGTGWDPRVLGWMALVLVVMLLAVRPGPAWIRIATVTTSANAFTLTYLAWGTNDALAACSFLLALLLAEGRPGSPARPGWAGIALALAVSCKFLFLVAFRRW